MPRRRAAVPAVRHVPRQRLVRPRPTSTTPVGLGTSALRALGRGVADAVDREAAELTASLVLALAPDSALLGRQRTAAGVALVGEVLVAARSAPPSRSVARSLAALRLVLGDDHPCSADLDAALASLRVPTAWLPGAPLRLHRLVCSTEVLGDVRATYALVDSDDLPLRVLGVQTDLNLDHASALLYVTREALDAVEAMTAEEPTAEWREVVDPEERAQVVAETRHALRELREQPVAWRCLDDSERGQQALLERRWAELADLVGEPTQRRAPPAAEKRAQLRAEFLASYEHGDFPADAPAVVDLLLDVDERWDCGWGRVSARKLSLLPERVCELRHWHAEDLPAGFFAVLTSWTGWCARRAGLPVEDQLRVLATVEALELQWDEPDGLLELVWGGDVMAGATLPPARLVSLAG